MRHLCKMQLYVLLALLGGSCNQPDAADCLKSTGSWQLQHRAVAEFDAIVLEDNINLKLTYGPVQALKVEAGKNLINEIKTEVSGKTLRISNTNTCNWVRSYKVPVNVSIESDQVKFIKHTGFGEVLFQNQWRTSYLEYKHYGAGSLQMNIKAEKLNFDHNGLGKAELSGTADNVFYAVQSLGPLMAKELQASVCEINNNGEADATVHCTEQLKAKVSAVGNIYYHGNPKVVKLENQGAGKILAKN